MSNDSERARGEFTVPAGTTTLLLQGLTALTALLFLIGWSYGRAYYGAFGIGLNQLEIPFTSYLVWVQPLILEAPFKLVILPLLLMLVPWGLRLFRHLRAHFRVILVSWILLVCVIFVIWGPMVAGDLGNEHATRDMHQATSTLPKVLLQMRTPPGEDGMFLDRLRANNVSDGDYLFLGRHRNLYYLIPYRGATGRNQTLVLVLPDAVVGAIRIREERQ